MTRTYTISYSYGYHFVEWKLDHFLCDIPLYRLCPCRNCPLNTIKLVGPSFFKFLQNIDMNRFLWLRAIHLVVGVMYFDNLAKCRNDVSGQAGVGRTITRSAGLPKKEWVLPHSTLRSASCWGIALLDNVIYTSTVSRSGISWSGSSHCSLGGEDPLYVHGVGCYTFPSSMNQLIHTY